MPVCRLRCVAAPSARLRASKQLLCFPTGTARYLAVLPLRAFPFARSALRKWQARPPTCARSALRPRPANIQRTPTQHMPGNRQAHPLTCACSALHPCDPANGSKRTRPPSARCPATVSSLSLVGDAGGAGNACLLWCVGAAAIGDDGSAVFFCFACWSLCCAALCLSLFYAMLVASSFCGVGALLADGIAAGVHCKSRYRQR